MLIPSPRFFVIPLATACVLIALAMTQRTAPQADSTAVLVVPAAKMQVCGHTSQDRACALPAG